MPNYGTLPSTGAGSGVAATVLNPGDRMKLFDNESPASPQQSISIAPSEVPSKRAMLFTIQAPTATIDILGANEDKAASYQKLYTATNQALAYYGDDGGFAFYSCQLSAGNGAVTVIVQR